MKPCLAALFIVLWSAGAMAQTRRSTGPVLAITHITVIDATGAAAKPDQTVVIEDGRIVALGGSATIQAPAGAEVVAGTGKFLIPGLWDMHAHIAAASPAGARDYLALYLANGVTGVREMHAYFSDMILQMRNDIETGQLTGPRIVAAGAMIDGPNPTADGAMVAADAAGGRSAVQSHKKCGSDLIRTTSRIRNGSRRW